MKVDFYKTQFIFDDHKKGLEGVFGVEKKGYPGLSPF